MMRHAALLGMLVVVCSGNREAEVEGVEGAPVDTGATALPTSSPTFRQLSETKIETDIKALKTGGGGGVTVPGSTTGTTVTRQIEEVVESKKNAGDDPNVVLTVKYQGDVAEWTEAVKTQARQAIATKLVVGLDRVEIQSVAPGSVVVVFLVLNAARTPAPGAGGGVRGGGDDGLSGGIIAVIVICCVLFVGGVVFVIVWFCCCDKDDSGDKDKEKEKDTASNTSKTDVENPKTDNAPNAAEDGADKEKADGEQ